ncbi:MAG: outer membrane protein [Pseudolabrys sp.]
MRRLFLALVASTFVAGVASAADMPVKAPVYKAPVLAPVYNWTGLYVGLNAGYSWGRQDVTLMPAGTVNSPKLNGFIGGGQIGYNWQMNQLVLGLEADFQGSGQKGDGNFIIPASDPCAPLASCPVPASAVAYTAKLDWFGTVRGRLGYAMDRWLPYITGGWAFGRGSISGTSTGGIASTFSGSRTYSGWTVGGGLEYAFTNNWSAKAEYLYIDFGNGPTIALTPAVSLVGGKMTDNILRLGVNYHF